MKISVVGLGKLGACLMAHLASSHDVIGVDLNAKVVHDLNDGVAPYKEPELQELLRDNRERYRATTDTFEIASTTMTFVVVPTPSDNEGRFVNDNIFQAVDMIGAALANKKGPHIVVITSTVMPGSTQGVIRQRLVMASGRSDLVVAYSPEFIALGSVIHDLQNPDMLLIGAEDGWAHALIAKVLDPDAFAPVARLNTLEAEIAKLSVNAYVTTKISFANTLGEICDHLDADARKVATAIGMDSRIGSKYLTPAGPFGGPCFPRDNQAFLAFAGDAPLAKATLEINDRQVQRTIRRLWAIAPLDSNRITVLGMAYKPDTPIVENSFGVQLVDALIDDRQDVTIYDPLALSNLVDHYAGKHVRFRNHAQPAVNDSPIVVIAQPHDEFRTLDYSKKVVLDVWSIL